MSIALDRKTDEWVVSRPKGLPSRYAKDAFPFPDLLLELGQEYKALIECAKLMSQTIGHIVGSTERE